MFNDLLKKWIKRRLWVFAFLVIPQTISAQNGSNSGQSLEIPFNVGEIVERISPHPVRAGDRIVTKDVLLGPRMAAKNVKDRVNPVSERSEMVDGRVIYQTENRDEFLIDTNIFYIPTPNYQGLASVAFGGTNYLVVWEDYRNGSSPMIYGARVAQDGTVLDNAGIFISPGTPGAQRPSVAFDGTNYLVVWQDSRSGSTDIYGARVTTSGVLLDTLGIPISVLLGRQEDASVAFDGTNYLVVWSDDRDSPWPDIYGARVTTDGVVLDPQGIPISTATEWQALPSVSFGGTNYLVVWDDCRNENDWNIYGARVTTDGVVLDPQGIPISTAVQLQHSTSVAFDGTNYLVVWEDERSGTYSDIYGARVSQNGTVLDPQGIPISTQPDNQRTPAVAHGIGNQLLIVYSGFVDYINNHPANTMRIWGKFYPFTGIEEDFAIAKNRPIFLQIEPNPFYSSTRIRYGLEKPCAVSLKIYNLTGQCVRTLIDAKQDVGIYEVNWSGKDDNQRELPQGIYFLRIKADGYTETKKMVLLH
ncbi:MAG: T9SS type A sorting domain-containing protein [candidate division WOR-3 bacterium]